MYSWVNRLFELPFIPKFFILLLVFTIPSIVLYLSLTSRPTVNYVGQEAQVVASPIPSIKPRELSCDYGVGSLNSSGSCSLDSTSSGFTSYEYRCNNGSEGAIYSDTCLSESQARSQIEDLCSSPCFSPEPSDL